MIKLTNLVFCNNFLINFIYIDVKILNFLFLKFYFLLIKKSLWNDNYFFFNFLFYKKLWLINIFIPNKSYYKLSFKKLYKKYYFLTYTSLTHYNYIFSHNVIYFSKNNQNFILKKNIFFLNFLKFNLVLPFVAFFKNWYFFSFHINYWVHYFLLNLNHIRFFTFSPLTFKISTNSNNFNNYIFKSIRYFSGLSLLKFNNLI